MMVAGHARAMGLMLETNNMKEFERALRLRIESGM
jgi:predicted nucleic acid-binding protein